MDTIETLNLESRDGFDVSGRIVYDDVCNPRDYDCYPASDIAAFDRGDWCFVGVVIEVSRAGIPLGDASLWGIDWQHPQGDDAYARETIPGELIPEAIETARIAMAKLCQSV